MKKLIFVLIIGSIITAQPHAFKRPFLPNKIPSSQDIQRMIHDQVINRSTDLFDYPTGRRTRDVSQIWNGTAWENNNMTEYVYAPAKIKAGKFPGPNLGLMLINYYLWSSGAWSANGY
ncbi:MAG: hypothetical protein GWP19_15700, partial [Planctomycetia bacterium]|nr:hypothetical protein [Planctomycetia bacterium]